MIKDGTVPTISIEELRDKLREYGLAVIKTENVKNKNGGYRPDFVLCTALNELILYKAEVDDDD